MHAPAKLENLQFTLSMLKELRRKADDADEKFLTYLIDMALAEAEERAKAIQSDRVGIPLGW